MLLLASGTSWAQDTPKQPNVVEKGKDGKPLPVCAPGQESTKEKPCRQMTISQRQGGSNR